MSNPFFDHPILNSPYEYPRRHWELDEAGQPTQRIVETRRGGRSDTRNGLVLTQAGKDALQQTERADTVLPQSPQSTAVEIAEACIERGAGAPRAPRNA